MFLLFFFQAEDGIRDHCVTGVQTCALPIYARQTADAVRIQEHGSEARSVERDPAGDDLGQIRSVLHDRGIAATIPRSRESPERSLAPRLRRQMRAPCQHRYSNKLACFRE